VTLYPFPHDYIIAFICNELLNTGFKKIKTSELMKTPFTLSHTLIRISTLQKENNKHYT